MQRILSQIVGVLALIAACSGIQPPFISLEFLAFLRLWLLFGGVALLIGNRETPTLRRTLANVATLFAGGAALASSDLLWSFAALEVAFLSCLWNRERQRFETGENRDIIAMIAGFLLVAVGLAWIGGTLEVTEIKEVSERFLPSLPLKIAAVVLLFGVALQTTATMLRSATGNEHGPLDTKDLLGLGLGVLVVMPQFWKFCHLALEARLEVWQLPLQLLGFTGLFAGGIGAMLLRGFRRRFIWLSLSVAAGWCAGIAYEGPIIPAHLAVLLSWLLGAMMAATMEERPSDAAPSFRGSAGTWAGLFAFVLAGGIAPSVGDSEHSGVAIWLAAMDDALPAKLLILGGLLPVAVLNLWIWKERNRLTLAPGWRTALAVAVLLAGLIYSIFPEPMAYFPGLHLPPR